MNSGTTLYEEARPFARKSGRSWPSWRTGTRSSPGAGDLEMDPIPADECRTLEAIIKDDLQRAEILSVSVYVDEDGSIEVEELALRIYGGREVVLAPEMRSKAPVIALEINPGDGWRDMTVEEDYSEELEELTAEPWHPEPPEPWDRE
jgi:hypothetical protein